MPGIGNSLTQGKIDVALSDFARKYRNNSFVAELLCPRVNVLKQTNKYWLFGRENQQLPDQDLRGPGAAAERVEMTLSTASYEAVDHSLEAFIPDEERSNYEAGDIEQAKTQLVMDKLLLAYEDRVATLATNTANYGGSNSVTLAGVQQWSDYTNSDPLIDIETGKKQIRLAGVNANLLILGDDVFTKLINHPDLVARFQYTTPRILTSADLAAIFGVEKVVVASAIKLSAALAASFIWGKNAILAYVQPGTSMEDVSFAKSFVWTGAPGTVGGFQTEIGRATPVSRKSDEIATHWYYDVRVTSNISAYLIKNAVA